MNTPLQPRIGILRSPIAIRAAWLTLALLAVPALLSAAETDKKPARPNIVFILADDLGYGDVHCLNPAGKIATPNMDRLAASGMIFTDAHSSSSLCTPTRYALLTGRYNWRSRLKQGVLGGYSRRLIEPDRLTLPAFLKQWGYATGCVGKWHLGMDWPLKAGGFAEDYPDAWKVDYAQPIKNGPTTVGFDEYFGISASLDMPPYVFIENDRATAVPTTEKQWIRKGPAAETFEAVDVLPVSTRKAVAFVGQHALAAQSGHPFFLYMPLTAPHTPIVPDATWKARSGLNAYADFVMQVDATVGTMLDAIDRNGLGENTLFILTSDNGCSPSANFPELLAKGHNPSASFRGHKADLFEGGHRMPFLVRWPARVKPGTTSDQLICQLDLMATCADILGAKLPETAAEDSVSFLPALEGKADKPLREALVHHSGHGSFTIRQGPWKLLLAPDSGGWSAPHPGSPLSKTLPPVQLYNLATDIGETTNVQDKHPEIVARLTALLERYVADGRSTPGAPQPNNGPIELRPQTPVAAPRAATRRGTNFVFVLADDLGWRDLGCTGSTFYETPNLDRLAEQGVRFVNAYSACSVCSPTRASILTGKYPARIPLTDFIPGAARGKLNPAEYLHHLPLEENTIAEALKAAGYRTGLVGKWHLGAEGYGPGQQGFDVNVGGSQIGHPPSHFSPYRVPNLTDGPPGEYLTDRLTDEAIRFIEDAHRAEKPFYLQLCHYAVHTPLQAKPELVAKYRKKAAELPKTTNPAFLPEHSRRTRQIQNHPVYAAMIESLDQSMGRLLETLDRLKIADRTVVIFTSDNGGLSTSEGSPTSNVPLRAGKGWPYEGGVRVPLIIKAPGTSQAGLVTVEPAISTDYYPTILTLAGLPPRSAQHLDGVNIAPLLRESSLNERSFYWHYPHYGNQGGSPNSALRTGNLKLIEWFEDQSAELYDLQRDPGETHNLAADRPEAVKNLRRQLDDWRKSVGARLPSPNPDYHPPGQ